MPPMARRAQSSRAVVVRVARGLGRRAAARREGSDCRREPTDPEGRGAHDARGSCTPRRGSTSRPSHPSSAARGDVPPSPGGSRIRRSDSVRRAAARREQPWGRSHSGARPACSDRLPRRRERARSSRSRATLRRPCRVAESRRPPPAPRAALRPRATARAGESAALRRAARRARPSHQRIRRSVRARVPRLALRRPRRVDDLVHDGFEARAVEVGESARDVQHAVLGLPPHSEAARFAACLPLVDGRLALGPRDAPGRSVWCSAPGAPIRRRCARRREPSRARAARGSGDPRGQPPRSPAASRARGPPLPSPAPTGPRPRRGLRSRRRARRARRGHASRRAARPRDAAVRGPAPLGARPASPWGGTAGGRGVRGCRTWEHGTTGVGHSSVSGDGRSRVCRRSGRPDPAARRPRGMSRWGGPLSRGSPDPPRLATS
jgi:hypothetical protein